MQGEMTLGETTHELLAYDPESGDIVCRRDPHDPFKKSVNIPQILVRHSPDGFEWGYGGSGPADFALNIAYIHLKRVRPKLTDEERERLAHLFHQQVKWKFVSSLPEEGGRIKGEDIADFLRDLLNEYRRDDVVDAFEYAYNEFNDEESNVYAGTYSED